MENKSSNKTLTGILIGIILMLVIVLGLFFTGVIKFQLKENNDIRIDNSKYYVYDAQYNMNTKYNQYGKAFSNEFDTQMTHDGFNTSIVNNGVLHITDLKVPYININTSEVKDINDNLKKLYEEYVKKYDEAANNFNKIVQEYGTNFNIDDVIFDNINDRWFYPMLTYYTYEFNDILSVVVTYGVLGTDILHPEYLVYNFDLKDGKVLDYKNFLDKFKLNASEATPQVINKVNEYVDSSDTYILEEKNTTEEYLKKSINDGTILYFVDNQGNINYIVDIYMNAGSGKYPQKITITK